MQVMNSHLFNLLTILYFSIVPLLIGCSSNRTPKIALKKNTHEFSEVFIAGSEIAHIFSFTNEGTAPLQIKSFEADCGCVATNIFSNRIPPEGIGMIRVAVERDNQYTGSFVENVSVYTNDPSSPIVYLQVRGTILTPLTYPKKIELGRLDKGKLFSKIIKFKNNLKNSVEITGHTVSNKGLTITSPKKNIPAGESIECEAVLMMNDVGLYDQSITITAQTQEELPRTESKEFEISIQFQGRVLGGVVVLPQNLFLGVLDSSGKIFQKKIQIKTDGSRPFGLKSISADNYSVATSLSKEALTVHEVELTITPKMNSKLSGLVEGTIQILTTNPDVPKIIIPIKAVPLEKYSVDTIYNVQYYHCL